MLEVVVDLGDRSYPIVVGDGVLADVGARLAAVLAGKRIIVVTDKNVAATGHLATLTASLAAAGFELDVVTIPAGESSKSFGQFEQLMHELLALRPDRKTTLLAFGGGVVGDLTGFAASSLLRGVPFVQVPTTLLAMVDSAVGGKTGINTAYGKNLVGAFYQPQAVIADVLVLETLPEREFLAGYAEIVKYGLIDDEALFDQLEADGLAVADMVQKSCEAKARIVAADEREQGCRALLNLGHTFGHALEAEMGYDGRLLHGEAVAIGMVMAFDFSAQTGLCQQAEADRVRAHFVAKGLKVSAAEVAESWDVEALLGHMKSDKKAENGTMTFVLVRGIGAAFVARDVAEESVREFLQKVLG